MALYEKGFHYSIKTVRIANAGAEEPERKIAPQTLRDVEPQKCE
jgi:hypothetical protein